MGLILAGTLGILEVHSPNKSKIPAYEATYKMPFDCAGIHAGLCSRACAGTGSG